MSKTEQENSKVALRELLAPVRKSLWVGRALALCSAALGVVPYIALVQIGNLLVEDGVRGGVLSSTIPGAEIEKWVMILVGAFTLRLAVYFLGLVITHFADIRLGATIQERLISQLRSAQLSWFGENTAGRVRKVLQDDVKNLHMLVAHRPVDSLVAIFLPVFSTGYVFWVDWRLGLLCVASILIYAVVYSILMRGVGMKTLELDRKLDAVSSAMIEFVRGIQVVKTFGIVGRAHRQYAQAGREATDFMEKWNRPMITASSITTALVSTPLVVLLFAGCGSWFVSRSLVTPVEVVAACFVGVALPSAINLMANLAWNYQCAAAAAQRILEAISIPAMQSQTPNLEPGSDTADLEPQTASGRVELRDVSLSYGEVQALRGVSLVCQPGTITALLGPSGAGKSTLAKLVARFYDPDEGQVLIGGRDLRGMSGAQLYRQVSFVLQDAQMLRASVAENIALGRPGANREQIEEVARLAQIHDEILALPRGYDTVIDQEVALSGGQRQRLAIARALLIDAPVLILDESVAMVDPECEAQIQAAIQNLIVGRTVIVIDHRPASIRNVDQIVLLDRGRVVARGRHQDLVEVGLYRQLWEASGVALEASREAAPEAGEGAVGSEAGADAAVADVAGLVGSAQRGAE